MQGANISKNDKKHMQNNAQASDVTTIKQKTCKTVCKTLTWKITKHYIFKTERKALPEQKTPTEPFQNGARGTKVPKNRREHIQNSA